MHAHTWHEERVVQTGEFGQSPSVGVLSCADSRVPVEIIFDQGVGDLFVVRLAGFIDTVEGAGTFEYGYLVLGMHSLLVLGHTKCGAVDATIKGKPLPGNIPVLAKAIAPAVADTTKNGKEDKNPAFMNAAVEANVRYQMKTLLARSEILRKAQAEGKLTVLGGIYDVDTGAVRFLD
jgi:carbonic anhydrase